VLLVVLTFVTVPFADPFAFGHCLAVFSVDWLSGLLLVVRSLFLFD
jgi:hypothetical protein